jgi:hypothetical protein
MGMFLLAHACGAMDVQQIIQKSVEANQRDFDEEPHYTYKETDRSGASTKTYQVLMLDGSTYNRLMAVDGVPLSPQQNQDEERKLKQVEAQRRAESPSDRHKRIAKYQQDRRRDNEMMQQLTVAFTFKLIGERKVSGFKVYALRATPKPGYQPPNMASQVLPGMNGELWIDQQTYNWVKVTAKVIHPVSIEGFFAEVEPGTHFELEKRPVGGGIWMPTHFAMYSVAKVLFFFGHNTHENETFWDYQRIY